MIDIDLIKRKFYKLQGMKNQLEKDLEIDKVYLEKVTERIKLLEKAQSFLQKIAQDTQSQLKFQIEDIVNLALETCFPNEYIFQLQFTIARGKTDAELVFLSQKTNRPIDPMNASGGGVVDITSFALRIASYVLEQGTDNVIILDEPMKFVSKDLQARVGDILKTLSEKLGLQVILVTHIDELINCADKVFQVKKYSDGKSKVQILKGK